jgi:hypothetical protein
MAPWWLRVKGRQGGLHGNYNEAERSNGDNSPTRSPQIDLNGKLRSHELLAHANLSVRSTGNGAKSDSVIGNPCFA